VVGNEIFGIGGFIFLWPVTFIALMALWICGVYTEAEYEVGVLTFGGKRMVQSRIALAASCGIYCLCLLLPFAIRSEPIFRFWAIHWQVFLIAMTGANVSSLVTLVYGFQARGSGRWIIRISTAVVAIASTALTVLVGLALFNGT
jgi:hypothetical protein